MSMLDLNLETNARANKPLERIAFPVECVSDIQRLRDIWHEREMIPVTFQNRDEAFDVSFGGRDSRLLLSGDESQGRYCIEDVIYAPGWDMPAYHMEAAEEHIYVIDGELEITVGTLTEVCKAGSFAFVPRHTTRAIRNRSGTPAHVLQWSNPAGFDRAVQELAATLGGQASVDWGMAGKLLAKYQVVVHNGAVELANDGRVNGQIDRLPFHSNSLAEFMRLRELWAPLPMIPKTVHGPELCPELPVIPGSRTSCMLVGDECAGRAMVLHHALQPGLYVPPHFQPAEEEWFFGIQEGMDWTVGDVSLKTQVGSFAFAPRYTTHHFGNPTEGKMQFITVNSPAGHERGLEASKDVDLSDPANHRILHNWGWHLFFGKEA